MRAVSEEDLKHIDPKEIGKSVPAEESEVEAQAKYNVCPMCGRRINVLENRRYTVCPICGRLVQVR